MNGRFTKHRTLLNAMLFCSLLLCIALFTQTAFAGTLDGTVKNGTNGKIATGTDVILIQLQGGMQPVANTKTDAQGHYHFDNPQLGTGAHAGPRCLPRRELP